MSEVEPPLHPLPHISLPIPGAVQAAMGPTQEDEQHTHSDLQHERDGDEDHKGHEEGEIIALLHHGLQLRRIGHEQRDVQHALRSTLLVGVMVYIDGPVPQTPAGWLWGARCVSTTGSTWDSGVSYRKRSGQGSNPPWGCRELPGPL